MNKDLIQTFLDDESVDVNNRKTVFKMLQDNVPKDIVENAIKEKVGYNSNLSTSKLVESNVQNKSPLFKDQYADEGEITQAFKAPLRGIKGAFEGIKGGAEEATKSLIGLGQRAYGDITGDKSMVEGVERLTGSTDYLGDITGAAKGVSQAAFGALKAPLNVGLNTAAALPGVQYITQGLGKGIEGVGNLISEGTGIENKKVQDVIATGMNIGGLKAKGGGTMQTIEQAKQAYRQPSLNAASKVIEESTAKTPAEIKNVANEARNAYDAAKLKGTVDAASSVLKETFKSTKDIAKLPIDVLYSLKDKFSTVRPAQDIAGNILQPNTGVSSNLADATKGLQTILKDNSAKDLSGKLKEKFKSGDNFETLMEKTNKTQDSVGSAIRKKVEGLTGNYKSPSIQNALDQLLEIYKDTKSFENQMILNDIKTYRQLNDTTGLTPSQINEIKVLHTKSNNLFNTKGQQIGGFDNKDLQGIRSELAQLVEDIGTSQSVTDIKPLNKSYGEIADTNFLLQKQIDKATSAKGKELPKTAVESVADFIVNFPIVKQLFSDPVKSIGQAIFKTMGSGENTTLKAQKRLPALLNELRKSGMKESDIKTISDKVNEIFIKFQSGNVQEQRKKILEDKISKMAK